MKRALFLLVLLGLAPRPQPAAEERLGPALTCFLPTPVSNDGLRIVSAKPISEVTLAACRGEFESVGVTVLAREDLASLVVSAGTLHNGPAVIPPDCIDVRVIKRWFQAGTHLADVKHKSLVPELLLKDDDLVRVDQAAGASFLRSGGPAEARRYVPCSAGPGDPANRDLDQARPMDARELQPVNVAAGGVKEFWITVHVPADAPSGRYAGVLRLGHADGAVELPFFVTVRAFDLARSPIIYSIYYRGRLSPDGAAEGPPCVGSERKSEQQYRAELLDMKAHGIEYPNLFPQPDEERTRCVFEIRREIGLDTAFLFALGFHMEEAVDDDGVGRLALRVRTFLETARSFGYREVFCYGIDEASGAALRGERAAFAAVRSAGARTFASCRPDAFDVVGDWLDCAVVTGKPSRELARKWHRAGGRIFCYGYPQGGQERPLTYRRNYGLALWKAGYDGAMPYAYQHGFGHIWNDFDSAVYRDHNFTYPTVDGVVGTLQWEGLREGIDDVRYAATLERAIERALSGRRQNTDRASAGRRKDAGEARRWLKALDPEQADLDRSRDSMARWITTLEAP